MILFRYLCSQIMQVMAGVSLILLVVGLTSRFIQYLSQAVAGELAADVLLLLMLYRLPDFFLVIVPLSFFLGIILVYGRMYDENEMVVLLGSGLSERRLLGLTFLTSIIVVFLMGLFSLTIAPWGARNTEEIKQSQEQLTEIDLIVEGQFQAFDGGSRVTYVDRTITGTDSGKELENLFVAMSRNARSSNEQPESNDEQVRILLAEVARPIIDESTGARLMQMENVYQYDGSPGMVNFSIAQFDMQSILLPPPSEFEETFEEESLRTMDLIGSNSLTHQAELQWRLSLIFLVPIITLIAVPLSKVGPRQGRYGKLVPAALIYAVYFFVLQFARGLVSEGSLTSVIGLWWVHILFGIIGITLYRYPDLGRFLSIGRSA
ncbi:MAG: LPS export ABC transporter permease LptF [Gammaproteobacteria bacterium]|nr:LPS export ABC transporter permease LptF [Gammaproteobacteria bacterium]